MSYKIEHLGLGGILDQGIAITRNHFGLLFTIILLLQVPYTLITELAGTAMQPEYQIDPDTGDLQVLSDGAAELAIVQAILGIIGGLFVYPLTNAAVIQAVARLYLGLPVTATEAFRHGLRRWLPLIGTTILMYLAIWGGLLLCIVPGILFALWFGLAQHVVVVEGIAGSKALGRSKKLVRPHLGTFLVLGILVFAIVIGVQLSAYAIPNVYLQAVAVTLVTGVTTIIATAVFVVFYFSCRCAEENFDLQYLAESIGEGPEVAAVTTPS